MQACRDRELAKKSLLVERVVLGADAEVPAALDAGHLLFNAYSL